MFHLYGSFVFFIICPRQWIIQVLEVIIFVVHVGHESGVEGQRVKPSSSALNPKAPSSSRARCSLCRHSVVLCSPACVTAMESDGGDHAFFHQVLIMDTNSTSFQPVTCVCRYVSDVTACPLRHYPRRWWYLKRPVPQNMLMQQTTPSMTIVAQCCQSWQRYPCQDHRLLRVAVQTFAARSKPPSRPIA